MLELPAATMFIAFIVLLFSLTVHESAHAWAADRLGDPTGRLLGRISLNPIVHADPVGTLLLPLLALVMSGPLVTSVPLIGWAKPVPVDPSRLGHSRRDYVLVAAAGPASNVLLALIAGVVLLLLPVSPVVLNEVNVSVPLASLFTRAVQINVFLAIFNMIPIPPLDGGTVLSGLLPQPLALGFDRFRPYGFVLLCALMLTGSLQYVVGPPSTLVRSLLP